MGFGVGGCFFGLFWGLGGWGVGQLVFVDEVLDGLGP